MTRREEVNQHARVVAISTGQSCKIYGFLPRSDKPALRISVRVK